MVKKKTGDEMDEKEKRCLGLILVPQIGFTQLRPQNNGSLLSPVILHYGHLKNIYDFVFKFEPNCMGVIYT